MFDLEQYIDSIIFGTISAKKTQIIKLNKLPVDEQFLINIIATRNIKRIPSISFCFAIESRMQELVSEGDLYLSNTEVLDNLVKYLKRFPPHVYKPCLLYLVRTMFTGLHMKISPVHSIHWRWASGELFYQINGSGYSFNRIDLLRRYYRYVPLSQRKHKTSTFLHQRTVAQGIRKQLINLPKPTNPLVGHPLFRKKIKKRKI